MGGPIDSLRRIQRSNYELHIEEDSRDQTFLEITVVPRNYDTKVITNILLAGILNYGFYWYIVKPQIYLGKYSFYLQLGVLVASILVIKNPKVEQITVIKDCGIQLSHWNGYMLLPYTIGKQLTRTREFISRDRILDVIINEGFYQWYQVIFYLCIMIRDERKLKIMFPGYIKMKLDDEKLIYQLCQRYLYTRDDKIKHDCLH